APQLSAARRVVDVRRERRNFLPRSGVDENETGPRRGGYDTHPGRDAGMKTDPVHFVRCAGQSSPSPKLRQLPSGGGAGGGKLSHSLSCPAPSPKRRGGLP